MYQRMLVAYATLAPDLKRRVADYLAPVLESKPAEHYAVPDDIYRAIKMACNDMVARRMVEQSRPWAEVKAEEAPKAKAPRGEGESTCKKENEVLSDSSSDDGSFTQSESQSDEMVLL